jgi:hypothetical protein
MVAPRPRQEARSRPTPRVPDPDPDEEWQMTDPVNALTITLLVALLVIDRLTRR